MKGNEIFPSKKKKYGYVNLRKGVHYGKAKRM
jgi:hypothetical protein